MTVNPVTLLPPRFLLWKHHEITKPNGAVANTKVPCDINGYPVDAHNPTNWSDYASVKATADRIGLGVGFVFNGDGFFFIDLDDCREGDGWNAYATSVFQSFPGAMAEISQSGNGLHIIGWCQTAGMETRKNKWKVNNKTCEFYVNERFVAFGPHGWVGNPVQDFTASIMAVVPQRDPNEVETLGEGPRPEYTGPADDDVLIAKMLASSGSFSSMFGNKARLVDLWEGKASGLIQFFPSPSGDVFDRSSADAALMSHLAFWTGCDADRMDRLFRRSSLYREKYELRADYRNGTILNAIRGCRKVYDIPQKAQPVISQGTFVAPSGQHVSARVLDPMQQAEHFQGCVYVLDAHRVMIKDGRMLRPEQFKAYMGGYHFIIDNEGQPGKNAFEAFTESRVYRFPRASSTMFRPSLPSGFIDEETDKVNVYFPFNCKTYDGDPAPFLDLLSRLLPDDRDRAILLAYMASLVQNIGTKFFWAPVLQGTPGNGKTMVLKCIDYVIGERYTHYPAAQDLGNQFNSFLENKLFIGVEEIHMDGRREILDTLKPLITNDRVETQPKGIDKRMVDNFANWIFCTNYKDAVLTNKDDRRYAIFFTAQQSVEDIARDGMGGDYFPKMWKWLREQGGYGIVANFLLNYKIPVELDPAGQAHRAPSTSSTKEAITESMGRAEQFTLEAVGSELQGFRGGWISTYALDTLLKDNRIRLAPGRRDKILKELGYVMVGKVTGVIMQEDSRKPAVWIRKELVTATTHPDQYLSAQGYGAPVILPHMQIAAQ